MNDELTDQILTARKKLERRLSDIGKITEINDIILMVVRTNVNAIKRDLVTLGRGGGIANKLDNTIKTLESTMSNSQVLEMRQIIREQVLVLYTGSLESYLSDTIRIIGNTQPEFFRFKTENENITFNQSMLRDSFTLGDAILEHIENKKYSFQDLKSTIDVFENYLEIALEVEEYKDLLILMAASRHIIVHNNSLIDRKFLKQIRDTVYKDKYELNNPIEVNDEIVDKIGVAIAGLADQVVAGIISRDE